MKKLVILIALLCFLPIIACKEDNPTGIKCYNLKIVCGGVEVLDALVRNHVVLKNDVIYTLCGGAADSIPFDAKKCTIK